MLRDLPLDEIQLTPEAILLLLLPALLFEATLHIEARALRKTLFPVGLLAVPGVLLNAAIVGALVHWGAGVAWNIAFLFGAIVAATDPIAVLAIFKQLHAHVAWNSSSKVRACSTMALALCWRESYSRSCWSARLACSASTVDFAVVVGGGLIIGTLAGFLASRITAHIDDHLIEIT